VSEPIFVFNVLNLIATVSDLNKKFNEQEEGFIELRKTIDILEDKLKAKKSLEIMAMAKAFAPVVENLAGYPEPMIAVKEFGGLEFLEFKVGLKCKAVFLGVVFWDPKQNDTCFALFLSKNHLSILRQNGSVFDNQPVNSLMDKDGSLYITLSRNPIYSIRKIHERLYAELHTAKKKLGRFLTEAETGKKALEIKQKKLEEKLKEV